MATSRKQQKRKDQRNRPLNINEQAGVQMAVADLRWCIESFQVMQLDAKNSSILALIVLPFYSQVLIESSTLKKNLQMSRGLQQWQLSHSDEAAKYEYRMRHRLKFVDNTKIDIPTMETELEHISVEFYSQFRMHPIKCLRRFQTDLGMYYVADKPVGANFTATFHLGYDSPEQIEGEHLRELSAEYGADLRFLFSWFSGETELPLPPTDADVNWSIRCKDCRSEEYFGSRYTTGISTQRKRILFLIESGINDVLFILPRLELGFRGTYFRKLVLIAYHSLNTIRKVIPEDIEQPELRAFRKFAVNDSVALLLESDQGRALRNRCMHYLNTYNNIVFDSRDPESCIVKSLFPGMEITDFEKKLSEYLTSISTAMTNL
ncbi:hypothetical protein [Bifidobacterium psychraerophilum]|uniref:hypothetical protein n=1 Tax=Bifidobacterium psychraerophilum TaxID=218140 RepID=UPI0039EBB673